MYEVLSQLCFLKSVLKFSVQTFNQPLFSNFPLTILSLQQFFPSVILFPSKRFPHQKAQSKIFFPIFKGKNPPKSKSQMPSKKSKGPKAQSKAPKRKSPKKPLALLQWAFYKSGKQGGAEALGEGHDILAG
jgi:hypothetical protein